MSQHVQKKLVNQSAISQLEKRKYYGTRKYATRGYRNNDSNHRYYPTPYWPTHIARSRESTGFLVSHSICRCLVYGLSRV